ncbi:MAG: hypothetical protein KME17_27520 [Cyanosarcina radialis HA8281-LM2]|nr:hypothetical protein [Cyanosarcina radialis HA8281-LM2]
MVLANLGVILVNRLKCCVLTFHNQPSDLLASAHRINGDDTASDFQHFD